MPDFDVKEKRFEQDIEEYLLTHGGYQKGNPAAFNREKALDTATFLSFIRTSQPKQWERFEKIYGADSERQLIDRFCREVKLVGLLKVLRQGFTDRGIKFRAVFWKPETSINETSQAQYAANILHCTRQLHYSLSNENSIDIVLFLNGIPVVSMELKCQFTGQDTANAIQQYKFDRAGKDAIFEFKNRVLVHFAVDLTNVYMTTRLEGAKTYFLPFNQGSNGAGNVGGKGNPINPDGYDTAYLWENVLCKDRLLEILHKYLHLQQEKDEKTGEVKSERMIFPRYHQLDVVTKLLADVKANGSGKNYLIQHSAGSPVCTMTAMRKSSSPLSSSPTAGCWTASCKTPSISLTMWRAWCRRSTRTPSSSGRPSKPGRVLSSPPFRSFQLSTKKCALAISDLQSLWTKPIPPRPAMPPAS